MEFHPFPDVPAEAVEAAKAILRASSIDVGGAEYLETPDGRRVFYDVNANSNLRPSGAEHFGVSPSSASSTSWSDASSALARVGAGLRDAGG